MCGCCGILLHTLGTSTWDTGSGSRGRCGSGSRRRRRRPTDACHHWCTYELHGACANQPQQKTNTICFPPAVQCSFILLLFSVCWLFLFFYYCLHSVNKDGHISSRHRNICNVTFWMKWTVANVKIKTIKSQYADMYTNSCPGFMSWTMMQQDTVRHIYMHSKADEPA